MRAITRFGIIGMAILALTTGIATVSHGQGANGNSPKDFVGGGGHHSVPDTQFTLSIHSGPLGENPKGQMSFMIDGQDLLEVDVTCHLVVDNQAIATGVITRPAVSAGQPVVMHAIDSGEPDGTQIPDLLRFSFTGFITPTPTFVTPPTGQDLTGCLVPVLPPVPVTQGNIVVHDAQP